MNGAQTDQPLLAVQRLHVTELEVVTVVVAVGEVVHLVLAAIEHAGSHFVQQGLPDVGGRPVHQDDAGTVAQAQLAAQAGGQLQAPGTAANDDNAR